MAKDLAPLSRVGDSLPKREINGARAVAHEVRCCSRLKYRCEIQPAVRSDSLNQPVHRFKAEFFKALAHPARIKILEFLRSGERTVGEIQVFLEIEPAATSQQLAVLRLKNIVVTRKEGNSVYYAVRDPAVFELLDVARKIFNNHLIDTRDMLAEIAREDEAVASRSPSAPLG